MTTPFDLDWYFDKVKYSGTDDTTRAVIATTLAKLPEEVAMWAVEAVVFVSVGGQIRGCMLSLSGWGEIRHVVALDEDVMRQRNGSYVVAHELAHARLGHPHFSKRDDGTEPAADRLAAEWGFEEVGAE